MTWDVEDTIAALASSRRGGARAILRISGPQTVDVLRTCFRSDTRWDSGTRALAFLGGLELADGALLPCELYFWPNSRSYTRQVSAELHLPGCIPLADAALERLIQSGARQARPGEFTLRAFLAGRIDLTQAEAVLGVIDAKNQRALESALRQLAGGMSSTFVAIRCQLLDLLADIEAGLDFVEEDISFVSDEEQQWRLQQATEVVGHLLTQMSHRSSDSSLPQAVLLGIPNAGKSSLFNALVSNHQAIVSSQSGTTRDYVTAPLCQGVGLPPLCQLIDTAGIDEDRSCVSHDAIQATTAARRKAADLLLICIDPTAAENDRQQQLLRETVSDPRILITTKQDLAALPTVESSLGVSSHTREGIVELKAAIADALEAHQSAESQVVAATAVRCRQSLIATQQSLLRCQSILREQVGDELLAAELRVALDGLGHVVGAVYNEEVLDRIFSRFCIGK